MLRRRRIRVCYNAIMDQDVIDYIRSQQFGVLAIEMMDGAPHASTLHFTHTENPLVFYFGTYRNYRKAEALLGRAVSRASFVIGSDPKDMRTLQLDGEVKLLSAEEQEQFKITHLSAFPDRLEKSNDPNFILFMFTPMWWRFSDWTRKDGKVIRTSE
jgi:general stress protein 26